MILYFYILPAIICMLNHNIAVYKDPYGHTRLEFIAFNILSWVPVVNLFLVMIMTAFSISKAIHSNVAKSIYKWLSSPLKNKPGT